MTKALWGWAVRPVRSPLQMNISQRQAGPTAAPPCQPVTGKPPGNLTGGECGSSQGEKLWHDRALTMEINGGWFWGGGAKTEEWGLVAWGYVFFFKYVMTVFAIGEHLAQGLLWKQWPDVGGAVGLHHHDDILSKVVNSSSSLISGVAKYGPSITARSHN